MEAKKAVERDWSSLSPELLNLIAKNLSEISDFVRFRAVCKAWHFSTRISDLPPQFPWIVDIRGYPYEPHMLVYSTTSSKIYTIHAPKSLGKRFLGSSLGYMLTDLCDHVTYNFSDQHTYQLSLLNPLNNHEIPLPACDFGSYTYLRSIGPQQYQIGEYVVCSGYVGSQHYNLVLCRLGQDNWCKLKLDSNEYCLWFHFKSFLFSVEDNGVTKVTDMATGTLAYVIPIPQMEDYELVVNESLVDASGDILRVCRHCDSSEDSNDDWFDVHRLDFSGSSSPCWVKVNSIGNQALFIDGYGGFALGASDFSRVKANCIYYIECRYGFKRIDIENGDKEFFQCPLKNPERWFVPNLGHLQA